MAFVTFGGKFPDIAVSEMRTVTVPDNGFVPRGEYGLIEFFCNEVDCDCRRVYLNVYSKEQDKFVAVVAYGWESEKFYAKLYCINGKI